MKRRENKMIRKERRSIRRRLLSSMLACITTASMLCGSAMMTWAGEEVTDKEESTQIGKDVTLHFGNDSVALRILPETDAAEAADADPVTAETEAEIEFDGKTFVYEDDKIKVTATLQYEDAVPKDAEFRVTELSGDVRKTYMDALNANAEEVKEATGAEYKQEYDDLNTLLYDVAFLVDKTDEDGNPIQGEKVEYEPKAGSVKIDFIFKNSQLTNGMNESAENLSIVHLPLKEEVKEGADTTLDANAAVNDIQIDVVDNTTTPGGSDQVEFSLNGLSVTAIIDPSSYKGGTITINTQKNGFLDAKYAAYRNDNSCVGPIAGSFHVVAFDTAELSAHTNGNILAKNVKATSNFGTNPKSEGTVEELSYIQNYQGVNGQSASVTNGLLALGSSNTKNVTLTDNNNSLSLNGTKIDKPKNFIFDQDTATAPFIDLEELKKTVDSLNAALAMNATQGVSYNVAGDQNKRYIDVSSASSGAAYLNIPASEITKFKDNPLYLEGFSSSNMTSLVVNIDCSGMKDIQIASEINVYVDGQPVSRSETVNFSTGKVIWNFINTTPDTKITMRNYFGQIIAPNASVELSNGNGNVIATDVHVTGESHRHDFTGTTVPAALDLTFTKTVEDKAPGAGDTFTFELKKLKSGAKTRDDEASWEAVLDSANNPVTATSDAQGNFSFAGKLSFSAAGTYYYKVSETAASAQGYNAPGPLYIKVEVENQGTQGDIRYVIKTCKYYTDSSCTQEKTGDKVFNNIPQKERQGDSEADDGYLEVSKTFTGLTEAQIQALKSTFSITVSGQNKNATLTLNDQAELVYSDAASLTYTYRWKLDGFPAGSYQVSENIGTTPSGYEAASKVYVKDADGEKEIGTDIVSGTPVTVTVTAKKILLDDVTRYTPNKNVTITKAMIPSWASGTDDPIVLISLTNSKIISGNTYDFICWTPTELPSTTRALLISSFQKSLAGEFGAKLDLDKTLFYSGDGVVINGQTITFKNDSITFSDKSLWNMLAYGGFRYEAGVGGDIRFTNNYTETIDLSGKKIWVDGDGTGRPAEITVTLMAGEGADRKAVTGQDGKPVTAKATANNNWQYTFTKLPKKDDSGNEIRYSVEETAIAGYEASYAGNDVINTGSTKVSVTKQWVDHNDQPITMTTPINVKLYRTEYDASGTKIGEETIIDLSAPDNSITWKYTGGGTVTINKDKDTWQLTPDSSGSYPTLEVANLPKGNAEKKTDGTYEIHTFKYAFKEVDHAGSDVRYSIDAAPSFGTGSVDPIYVTEGKTTLINKSISYALPATGGSGTGNIMLIGVILIALAGIGFAMKKTLRRSRL